MKLGLLPTFSRQFDLCLDFVTKNLKEKLAHSSKVPHLRRPPNFKNPRMASPLEKFIRFVLFIRRATAVFAINRLTMNKIGSTIVNYSIV